MAHSAPLQMSRRSIGFDVFRLVRWALLCHSIPVHLPYLSLCWRSLIPLAALRALVAARHTEADAGVHPTGDQTLGSTDSEYRRLTHLRARSPQPTRDHTE